MSSAKKTEARGRPVTDSEQAAFNATVRAQIDRMRADSEAIVARGVPESVEEVESLAEVMLAVTRARETLKAIVERDKDDVHREVIDILKEGIAVADAATSATQMLLTQHAAGMKRTVQS